MQQIVVFLYGLHEIVTESGIFVSFFCDKGRIGEFSETKKEFFSNQRLLRRNSFLHGYTGEVIGDVD